MNALNIIDLRNYRAICADIVRRESRLQESAIHAVDVVQGSANFPYNKHTVKIEGDIYGPGADLERKKIALLKIKKRDIEESVNDIDDYLVRYAITRHYLDETFGERITWESVADELGNTTGNAIKLKVCRYFAAHQQNGKGVKM